MGFMQPQVFHGGYFKIETTIGTEIVPAHVVGQTTDTHTKRFYNYVEGRPLDLFATIPYQEGWLARMSAPGYMDCTDWSVHATEEAAYAALAELYGE